MVKYASRRFLNIFRFASRKSALSTTLWKYVSAAGAQMALIIPALGDARGHGLVGLAQTLRSEDAVHIPRGVPHYMEAERFNIVILVQKQTDSALPSSSTITLPLPEHK